MRIAIIDLGTNTFNLLIADTQTDLSYTICHEEKQAVKIGLKGINQQQINDEAMERAIKVLVYYQTIIADKGADRVLAFATSAVRSADNKEEFLQKIKQHTGLDIRIISGEEEAELIYQGVRQTVDLGNETVLILDIGGGSNEFVIANGAQVFWKHSFPLGIARIIELFPPEDPLAPSTLRKVEGYFEKELSLLWEETKKYPLRTLVGSSGSFDTYRAVLTNGRKEEGLSFPIPLSAYFDLHTTLLTSTTKERLSMKGMEPVRVEMIVYASIFTNIVVRKLGIKQMIQSEYALKEGAMLVLIKE